MFAPEHRFRLSSNPTLDSCNRKYENKGSVLAFIEAAWCSSLTADIICLNTTSHWRRG